MDEKEKAREATLATALQFTKNVGKLHPKRCVSVEAGQLAEVSQLAVDLAEELRQAQATLAAVSPAKPAARDQKPDDKDKK